MKGCKHQENPDIMCLTIKDSNTIYSFAKKIQCESDPALDSEANVQKIKQRNRTASWVCKTQTMENSLSQMLWILP